MWLEAEACDIQRLVPAARKIAKIIRPVPIAVLQTSKQKVIYVNDSYYSTISNPINSHHRTAPLFGEHGSGTRLNISELGYEMAELQLPSQAITSSINRPRPSLSTEQQVEPRRNSLSTGSLSTGSCPLSDRTIRIANITSEEPNPTPVSSQICNGVPFVGLLKMEDSQGVQQRIQIEFELEVTTSKFCDHQTQITTDIKMSALTLSFEDPTIQGQPVLTRPQIPHLRAQSLFIKIRPVVASGEYVLLRQTPQEDFLDSTVTISKDRGAAVRGSVSAVPSVQAEFNMKVGESTNRTPLSRAFGKKMRIGKVNGQHYWRYGLTCNSIYSSYLLLPPHISTVKYSLSSPVTSVTASVEACLEINPDAKPKRLSKDRATPKNHFMEIQACYHVLYGVSPKGFEKAIY